MCHNTPKKTWKLTTIRLRTHMPEKVVAVRRHMKREDLLWFEQTLILRHMEMNIVVNSFQPSFQIVACHKYIYIYMQLHWIMLPDMWGLDACIVIAQDACFTHQIHFKGCNSIEECNSFTKDHLLFFKVLSFRLSHISDSQIWLC